MQFRADEYYRASLERMRQANHLYSEGQSFALAMYCGGLAVECLLRAFRFAEDDSFEGRHDLIALLRASRFLRVNEVYSLAKGVSREGQELEQVGLEKRAAGDKRGGESSCDAKISDSRPKKDELKKAYI